ncbi:hypothetical protein [Weissella cibaria]|nr:hypothetical protein [Weissella cibaria]
MKKFFRLAVVGGVFGTTLSSQQAFSASVELSQTIMSRYLQIPLNI